MGRTKLVALTEKIIKKWFFMQNGKNDFRRSGILEKPSSRLWKLENMKLLRILMESWVIVAKPEVHESDENDE